MAGIYALKIKGWSGYGEKLEKSELYEVEIMGNAVHIKDFIICLEDN